MLQAYSIGVDVGADSIVPFNNVALDKGCAEKIVGAGTIELNKAGVYEVHVDGTASAATTIQLLRNGVLLAQAQSAGTAVSFSTFVQVERNNCACNCCTAPVTIQVHNSTAVTFDNVNITVRKTSQ